MTGLVSVGCAKDASDSEGPSNATTMAAATTQPAAPAAAAAVPEKDMTRVVTKDEPYYAMTPAQAKKADGTLKAGTNVVLMMPRGPYAQGHDRRRKAAFTRARPACRRLASMAA
jgi:hypothetical protein